MSDPTLKDLRRYAKYAMGVLTAFTAVAVGAWKAAEYKNDIIDEIHKANAKTDVNTVSIEALKKAGWTKQDMLRWGIELDQGNRTVLKSNQGFGLYVPLATQSDQASVATPAKGVAD